MNLSETTEREKKKITSLFLRYSLLLLMIFMSSIGQAATCTWNSVYGNWSDPANWSPAGVPTATDDIIISTGKVLVDVEATVSTVTMSGGTIDGTENLTVSGDFEWSGGTVSAAAAGPSMIVNGVLTINGSLAKTLTFRTIVLNGSGSWQAGNVNIGSSTTFQIASGASFDFSPTSDATFGSTSSGLIDVQGTLNKTQTTTAHFNGILNVNGGALNVNAGTLDGSFASSGSHTGTIVIGSNSVLQFSGGTHSFESGVSLSGSGKLSVAGATVDFNVASPTTPDILLSSGTLNDNGGITVNNINQSNGTFSGTGTTQVNGLYTWSRGTISGSGSTTSDSMLLDGSSKTLQHRLFSLTGYGDWTDGHLRISTASTFQVSGGAVFTINHAGSHDFGNSSDGLIDIYGTVNKITNDRTSVKCQFKTASTAVVNLSAGPIRFFTSSSGDNEGTFNLSSGTDLWFYRGVHHFNSGASVTGDGQLLVTNDGDVQFHSGSALASNLEMTGGTLTDDAGTTPSSMTISGGMFMGTGSVNCTGDLDWSGGTIGGTNSLSIANTSTFTGTSLILDGKTLQINGTGDWQSADFTFSNSAVLNVGAAADFQLNHLVAQSISGTGTLDIDGKMSKRQNGVSTTINIATINDGTIEGIGNIDFSTITNNGNFTPGLSAVGELSVNKWDNTNGALNIEINATGTGGTDYDLLTSTGPVLLGGTLNVSLLGGFVPSIGNTFTILSATSVTGNFSTQNLPSLPSDRHWVVQYAPTSATLEVAALLPVELQEFSVRAENEKVNLEWSTASEKNNRGFDVQRSFDGNLWKSIHFVDGKGFSNAENKYEYQDYPNTDGTIYYRLRQVDWDGEFELSAVRSVILENGKGLGFFEVIPNPVRNNVVNVVFKNELGQLSFYEISDLKGNLVKKGALGPGNSEYQIEFNSPFSGYFNLNVQSGSHFETFKMLIK